MDEAPPQTIFFKRSHFATHLPADAFYSPSHFWLAREPDGLWRVGFTKFAVRMLGDLVDLSFELPPGAPVKPGTILGAIEGFKAISDIYCVIDGVFRGGNPELAGNLDRIHEAPYGAGWLYRAEGEPDRNCMPALEYTDLLNATIDRMMEQQKGDNPGSP
ncbi:MAG: glycine cleavage system protein H [Verrucomicrobia bacterium]|jgi:glycine cleavage system H protein|nr:glycine cleavage system protein H [Verrucomicrobiota bacterium]